MLTPNHLAIFDIPYFNIAQIKQYQPEQLDNIKAMYKSRHQDWQRFIKTLADRLGETNHFAPPHIERWCNGWQVRKHFFAFFKLDNYVQNAPIISLILNRRRLMIHLDWHAYKATQSVSTLHDFNQWTNELSQAQIDELAKADFYFWSSETSEYDDFTPMRAFDYDDLYLHNDEWIEVGRVIEREDLAKFDDITLVEWAIATITQLKDIYQYCHGDVV